MGTLLNKPASVQLFHNNGGVVPGSNSPQYLDLSDTSEIMRLERDGNGGAGIGGFRVEELPDRVREYLDAGCRIHIPDKGQFSLTQEEIDRVVACIQQLLAESQYATR